MPSYRRKPAIATTCAYYGTLPELAITRRVFYARGAGEESAMHRCHVSPVLCPLGLCATEYFDKRVCVGGASVPEHTSETTCQFSPIFFSLLPMVVHGSVVVWQRFDMLCTLRHAVTYTLSWR